jgi:serine protease
MPVRVLDQGGAGEAADIASGIRWAVRRGASLINLSLEFGQEVTACGDIPGICEAIRKARRHRVMVVAAAGNGGFDEVGDSQVSMPAQEAFAVGATTVRGCIARYSNRGAGLDMVAPGGGRDSILSDQRCNPLSSDNPDIVQLAFESGRGSSGSGFELIPRHGTSMASAHVAGVAALVLATRRLHRRGRPPVVGRLERHLMETARPLGSPESYGAGLVNARRAVAPRER